MKSANETSRVWKRPGFGSLLRAEALKSRHAAPGRLAVILALPFPLAALAIAILIPPIGLIFAPWNYWYALLMPVTISLFTASVANLDARMGNRVLLSSGVALPRAWNAKVLWCLGLSSLSNLIVFALYALGAVLSGDATGTLSMLAAALAVTVASSWMIPATLFLTMRAGLLTGIFLPLALQLVLDFAWSAVPFWPAFPPTATIMLPTAFLPMLPSGEPASAGMALAESVSDVGLVATALVVSAVFTALLSLAGARWLARSEELR